MWTKRPHSAYVRYINATTNTVLDRKEQLDRELANSTEASTGPRPPGRHAEQKVHTAARAEGKGGAGPRETPHHPERENMDSLTGAAKQQAVKCLAERDGH